MNDQELAELFADMKPLGRAAAIPARPVYPVGDCHVGDCQRPADHRGDHGPATTRELRNQR